MPLATGYRAGVALRTAAYGHGWFKTRWLNHPVISVGNLTVGGTGKTPFVAFLAELLRKRGWKPVVLTRGYGRISKARILRMEPKPARVADPREVGDEPALLARTVPDVPIVVGADRYRAGLMAEKSFSVDVYILDDGFQHLSLGRDLDIVLVDVTQDTSSDALLPAGRLREPASALKRANFVVLTRAELSHPAPWLKKVSRLNPEAKTFHSTTRLCGLVDVESGKAVAHDVLKARRLLAFCGLGNPRAFFGDLNRWGFAVLDELTFADHHVYSGADMDRLFARARKTGAAALVTSEKDALNFPADWKAEVPILACVIQTGLYEAEAFDQALFARLEGSRKGTSCCASALSQEP